jgi:arsenical pump membrane protein
LAATLALVLLAAVLGFAIWRPRGLPEALAAVPAAGIAVAAGLVTPSAAWAQIRALGPTVAFLAAVLVLAHLADDEGVFAWAGGLAASASRGSPARLLRIVFAVAALVTAALSLDATVVLLTPVVLVMAARIGVPARPHAYACAHLSNSASLLLPVSNLTNLLAFAASGLGFASFAAVMALPWIAVIAVEYLVFRLFFRRDLAAPAGLPSDEALPPPRFALIVLAVTLAGFALGEPLGIHPAWIAAAGAVVLAARQLTRTPRAALRIARETNPAFCAFVLALGVVVLAVRRHGLGPLVAHLTPGSATFLGLLGTAVLAAVLANVVNNLPATLVLVPIVAHSPALVLAVLLGVNIGPNLTYTGSLATLLWRRVLHVRDIAPPLGEFVLLGALTVPACLAAATVALWLAIRALGVA